MRKHRARGLSAISAVAILLSSEPIFAQPIDEIVVTARKREEKLSDAPLAINAFGGDFLDRSAVGSLEDLEALVPGLVAQTMATSAGGIVYLRGVGSSSSSAFIDQAIAINIDGVAMANAHLLQAGQYDMEQIEVLRGPQALFFGKNSPGGVISIKSREPGDSFEFDTAAGYEFEAQEKFGEVVLSGPINDQLGVRLFARYSQMEGYYDISTADTPTSVASSEDHYTPSEEIVVRGSLVYEPNERFDLKAKAIFSRLEDEMGPQAQRVWCPTGSPQTNFGLTLVVPDSCQLDKDVVTGSRPPALLFSELRNDPDGYRENEQWFASLDMNFDLTDSLTLTSITGFHSVYDAYAADFMMQAQNLLVAGGDVESDQISEEIRLTSNFDAPINFLVGGYYETRDGRGFLTIPPFGPATRDDYAQEQMAYSFFGQMTWDITSQLVLSAGARYTHEEKDLEASSPALTFTVPVETLEFDDTSPEVTLAYYPTESITLFASYKEGFKSGGFDVGAGVAARAFAGAANTYDGENVEGFEVGGKFQLLQGNLQLNVTGFTYDYTDLQVSVLDNIALSLSINNAAEAKVRGVETDFVWSPQQFSGLTLLGNAAYLDAKYEEFISNCYDGQTIAQGCDLINSAGGPAQDLGGSRLLYAPEYTAGFGFTFDTTLPNTGLNFGLNADYRYSGGYQNLQAQQPGTAQGAFSKVNAGLSVSDDDGKWRLELIGRNLSDVLTIANTNSVPGTGSGTGTTSGTPADVHAFLNRRGREVMLRLTANWFD